MVRGVPWARILFAVAMVGAASVVGLTLAGGEARWWATAGAALALVASLAGGVFVMGSGLFARPVLGADPRRAGSRLALTFDDGPNPASTRRVMDLLEAGGHRATFFVIGTRAAAQPELLAEIGRRGHGLGNHSYDHSWATALRSVDALAEELDRAQALLARASGRAPRWFRPPAGVMSPRVALAARRAGLEIVGWTASAWDGVATSVERAFRRLERAARPGAILVLHDAAEHADRPPIAAAVLERLLPLLAERRLVSVTLDALLGAGDGAPRSAPDPARPLERQGSSGGAFQKS